MNGYVKQLMNTDIVEEYFKLADISITEPKKYPHILSVNNCFILGSVVPYMPLLADKWTQSLQQDAANKEALQQKQ
uniref:Uncharacterized protein n=1 Tax=Urocitellus parryii TaxID=9999 RepID=A0A8D2H425_UROPR